MDASFISFKQFHGGGNVLKKMIRSNLEHFDDISSTKPQLQKAKSIYSCYELLYIKAFDFLFKLKQLYLLLVKYVVTNNETNTFIQKNKTTMNKQVINIISIVIKTDMVLIVLDLFFCFFIGLFPLS